jgi:hypothetical protein
LPIIFFVKGFEYVSAEVAPPRKRQIRRRKNRGQKMIGESFGKCMTDFDWSRSQIKKNLKLKVLICGRKTVVDSLCEITLYDVAWTGAFGRAHFVRQP